MDSVDGIGESSQDAAHRRGPPSVWSRWRCRCARRTFDLPPFMAGYHRLSRRAQCAFFVLADENMKTISQPPSLTPERMPVATGGCCLLLWRCKSSWLRFVSQGLVSYAQRPYEGEDELMQMKGQGRGDWTRVKTKVKWKNRDEEHRRKGKKEGGESSERHEPFRREGFLAVFIYLLNTS